MNLSLDLLYFFAVLLFEMTLLSFFQSEYSLCDPHIISVITEVKVKVTDMAVFVNFCTFYAQRCICCALFFWDGPQFRGF